MISLIGLEGNNMTRVKESGYNISLSIEEFGLVDTSLDYLQAEVEKKLNKKNIPVAEKKKIEEYSKRISSLHKKISNLLAE